MNEKGDQLAGEKSDSVGKIMFRDHRMKGKMPSS
jgi:hypothetical protein